MHFIIKILYKMNQKGMYYLLLFGGLIFIMNCHNAIEEEWEIIKMEDTIPAYTYYLNKNPSHMFADSAYLRLEELYFEHAKSVNNIPAYEDFLDKYPKGKFSEKAKLKIHNLYNERHPDIRDVDSIRIVIDQSYDGAENYYSLTYEYLAKELLKHAGVNVVENNVKGSELVLIIKARGYAKKAYYSGTFGNFQKGYHYSGAFISGTISVISQNKYMFNEEFSGNIDPPQVIFGNIFSPLDAPFHRAIDSGSFRYKLFKTIRELLGESCLLNALKNNKNLRLRQITAKVLDQFDWVANDLEEKCSYIFASQFGPGSESSYVNEIKKIGPPIVKYLLPELLHEKESEREAAVKALESLHLDLKDDKLKAAYYIAKGRTDSCLYIGRAATGPLIMALKFLEPETRTKAAQVLNKFDWFPKNDEQEITYYIAQKNWEYCVNMGEQAVDYLIAALKYLDHSSERGDIGMVLVQIGKPAVEPLIAVLKDKDYNYYVRAWAAEVLGNIGDPRAIQSLSDARKERNFDVSRSASVALRKIKESPN